MMKRQLLMAERIMYVDATTPLNGVFTAKIKGELSEDNFRLALTKIQQKHPLLRATVDHSAQPGFIFQQDIAPIPLRIVARRTDEDWLMESEKEWSHLFEETQNPLAQVVWVKGEDVSEILWVMPHCICDGTSLTTLMTELLCLLDDPMLSLSPYEAFRSVEELLPKQETAKNERLKSSVYLLLARLFFFFKRGRKRKNPGAHYALHWKLDEQTSAHITETGKVNAISVHALICAAFMQAFQQIQGKTAKGKVISPVDIRRFMPSINEDHLFAFAPTVTLSLKPGSLLTAAKIIKEELLNKISKMNVGAILKMGEQMHPLVGKIIAVLRTSSGNHDITLSNMGRINMPTDFKHFELETLFSPTVAFPWMNANTLVVTTYRQQMDFTFMSRDQFLPRAQAINIKNKAMALLSDRS